MQLLTETVLNDWTSNYRDSFVAQTGNSSTSSVNKIVNDYVNYYERDLRKAKIGTPAGVFSAGATFSDKVEGFYSKIYSIHSHSNCNCCSSFSNSFSNRLCKR